MRRFARTITLGLRLLVLAGTGAAAATAGIATPATAGASTAATRTAASPANAAGFTYGSDSWPVPVTGKSPYPMTHLSGSYGGYLGMIGNWARTEGCSTGNFLAWAPGNSLKANSNLVHYHIGIGTGLYWYMGGPGVDPHWNGTALEADHWGAYQASLAVAAAGKLHITYPVMWADIELPGIRPAPDNGWDGVYTSPCSGVRKATSVPAAVDRAVFTGFADYLTTHSKFNAGIYSAPSIWTRIFGTGTASRIPDTYEWTYQPETASLSAAPAGWCLAGGRGCAQFFGGQTSSSKYALAWQWSGGGGVRNPYGDYDQIDLARTPGWTSSGTDLPPPAGLSVTVHGLTANFSWQLVDGAKSYHFQVFHWLPSGIYGSAVADKNVTGNHVESLTLPGGGRYAFRVSAYQPRGAWSPWRTS
jgi:hypothetical protein